MKRHSFYLLPVAAIIATVCAFFWLGFMLHPAKAASGSPSATATPRTIVVALTESEIVVKRGRRVTTLRFSGEHVSISSRIVPAVTP